MWCALSFEVNSKTLILSRYHRINAPFSLGIKHSFFPLGVTLPLLFCSLACRNSQVSSLLLFFFWSHSVLTLTFVCSLHRHHQSLPCVHATKTPQPKPPKPSPLVIFVDKALSILRRRPFLHIVMAHLDFGELCSLCWGRLNLFSLVLLWFRVVSAWWLVVVSFGVKKP